MSLVLLSERAEDDLATIWSHLAEASPDVATGFVARLRERCMTLHRFPKRGIPRSDLGIGIRVLIFGNYLICYRLVGGDVAIARVVHGSIDLDVMFLR